LVVPQEVPKPLPKPTEEEIEPELELSKVAVEVRQVIKVYLINYFVYALCWLNLFLSCTKLQIYNILRAVVPIPIDIGLKNISFDLKVGVLFLRILVPSASISVSFE
jgi:hypothetical protein